MELDIVLDTI